MLRYSVFATVVALGYCGGKAGNCLSIAILPVGKNAGSLTLPGESRGTLTAFSIRTVHRTIGGVLTAALAFCVASAGPAAAAGFLTPGIESQLQVGSSDQNDIFINSSVIRVGTFGKNQLFVSGGVKRGISAQTAQDDSLGRVALGVRRPLGALTELQSEVEYRLSPLRQQIALKGALSFDVSAVKLTAKAGIGRYWLRNVSANADRPWIVDGALDASLRGVLFLPPEAELTLRSEAYADFGMNRADPSARWGKIELGFFTPLGERSDPFDLSPVSEISGNLSYDTRGRRAADFLFDGYLASVGTLDRLLQIEGRAEDGWLINERSARARLEFSTSGLLARWQFAPGLRVQDFGSRLALTLQGGGSYSFSSGTDVQLDIGTIFAPSGISALVDGAIAVRVGDISANLSGYMSTNRLKFEQAILKYGLTIYSVSQDTSTFDLSVEGQTSWRAGMQRDDRLGLRLAVLF